MDVGTAAVEGMMGIVVGAAGDGNEASANIPPRKMPMERESVDVRISQRHIRVLSTHSRPKVYQESLWLWIHKILRLNS